MDLTDKLRQWGAAHAQARAAEQAAAQRNTNDRDLARQASRLREEADRLHRSIYGELGRERAR